MTICTQTRISKDKKIRTCLEHALYLDLYPTILNTDVLNIKKTYTLIDKMCEKRERHKKVKKKLKFKKFESNFFCCFLDIDRIINIKRRKTITHSSKRRFKRSKPESLIPLLLVESID